MDHRRQASREEIEEIELRAPTAYDLLDDKRAWGSAALREVAAYALAGIAARFNARDAEPELIEALADEEEDVRYQAAIALGHLKSKKALPRLKALAKDDKAESSWRDGTVADAAREAVRRIEAGARRD